MGIGEKIFGGPPEKEKNRGVAVKVATLVIFAVLILSGLSVMTGQAQPTGEGDDIIIGVYVYDQDGPLEELGVDLFNETGDLVDSELTNEDGEAWFHITEPDDPDNETDQTTQLVEATIEIEDPDDETEIHEIEVEIEEPEEGETNLEYYSVNLSTDYREEAEEIYEEYPYVVLAGGFLFLVIAGSVILMATGKMDKPW